MYFAVIYSTKPFKVIKDKNQQYLFECRWFLIVDQDSACCKENAMRIYLETFR